MSRIVWGRVVAIVVLAGTITVFALLGGCATREQQLEALVVQGYALLHDVEPQDPVWRLDRQNYLADADVAGIVSSARARLAAKKIP